jgi:hypothetical protein
VTLLLSLLCGLTRLWLLFQRVVRRFERSAQRSLKALLGFLWFEFVGVFCHDRPYIMNPETSFIAPFAKTERAKTQIYDLNVAIEAFFAGAGYEIVSECYPEADEEVWSFKLKRKLPHDLSVRAGEILHNLRSALDQMLGEIVVRVSKRSESHVEFPFGLNFGEFETALGKQKKLPADAIQMIRNLQPYNGGDPLLWLLHSTNRRDKHRMGLVPVNLRTGGKTSYLSVWYGFALVLGSRTGQCLENKNRPSNADYVRLAGLGRPWGMYGVPIMDPITGLPRIYHPGRMMFENVGPGSSEETFDFLTATPGTKFKTDFEPSFDIAFGNIGGLERKPIINVLSDLRDLVERILLTFQRRFFP